MNVRAFPRVSLIKLAELFDLQFVVRKASDKTRTIGNNRARIIKLLIRESHYMLDEPVNCTTFYIQNYSEINKNKSIRQPTLVSHMTPSSFKYGKPTDLNKFLSFLFDNNLLQPLTITEYSKLVRTADCRQTLDYPKQCVRYNSGASPWGGLRRTSPTQSKNRKQKYDPHPQFQQFIAQNFGVDPTNYSTLSQIGYAILTKSGCFDGVPELSGAPALFIRRCMTSPVIQTAYNKPTRIEGCLTQIDRKGSYTGIYTTFPGIPKGEPIVIQNGKVPTDADYYYIRINLTSFTSRHNGADVERSAAGARSRDQDPFAVLINAGIHYFDKNMFEFINTHYKITYKDVSGYYFNGGFNDGIKDIAIKLYNEREHQRELGNADLAKEYKILLNSLWGKSIQKKNPTYNVQIGRQNFDGFAEYNHNFLVSFKENRNDSNLMDCKLVKPLILHFIRPQFGINILSYSKTLMMDIIYRAIDNDIDIYYSNTDSLCLRMCDVDKLNNLCDNQLLGTQLGQFSSELSAPSYKFIGISARKYIHCLTNGEYHARYQKEPNGDLVEMFENLFRKLTQ
jgi:hypothetical protein